MLLSKVSHWFVLLSAAGRPVSKARSSPSSAAGSMPTVSSPTVHKVQTVSKTRSSLPLSVQKVREMNVPALMTAVDLSTIQLTSVDDDVLCVECQRPLTTADHYKSVMSLTLVTSLSHLLHMIHMLCYGNSLQVTSLSHLLRHKNALLL